MRFLLKILPFGVFFALITHFFPITTVAQSEQYTIEVEDIVIQPEGASQKRNSPTPSPEPQKQYIISQTELQTFTEEGYVIRDKQDAPLNFTISRTNIPIELEKESFEDKTESFDITLGSAQPVNYQVSLIQQEPFQSVRGDRIESTLCDNADSPCSDSTAKLWRSADVQGFGYNLGGANIPDDFLSNDYYRQFSRRYEFETPTQIIEGVTTTNTQTTVTLKATQPQDELGSTYQTVLYIRALPR